MKQLSLAEAEYVAHALAKELMDFDEPLPPFTTRYPGRLESCLAQPFTTYGGDDLYKSPHEKAALLFYLVIKNHPFENGNKRMAVTLTLVFLYKNSAWIDASPDDLYKIACSVAESSPDRKDYVLKVLTDFIHTNLTPPTLTKRLNNL